MTRNQQRLHFQIWLILLATALAGAIWFLTHRPKPLTWQQPDPHLKTLSS